MTTASLRILHLEDDPDDAELVRATLAADGLVATILRVEARAAFVEALQGPPFDVILADYNLPTFDGVTAQSIAAELQPSTPFIFVSGTLGEELAIERLKAGATDYVLKQRLGRLPSSVRRARAEAADRADRRRAEAEICRLNEELEARVIARTAELHTAQRFLDSIVENIPDAIFVKDGRDALKYVRVNRACEQLMGVPRDEWLGRTDAELLPASEARAVNMADREALLGGTASVDGREESIDTRRQGRRIVHTKKLVMPDEDGAPRYLICISQDITTRRLAEDALKQARLDAESASRAKSQFLSRMSHDLRTPLNAILGFAQLLELDELNEDQREGVSRIRRGGQHLLALINEVLDIARIEAGHLSLSLEPVSPLEIVQRAVELMQPLATLRNISLVIDHASAADAVVVADRERLSQVLLNLLSNAMKYNHPGGQVTISLDRVEGRRLRLGVHDTGAGIPPAKLALLFQPFERLGAEQSDVEGTGLGLVLSRGLAEAMGGSLGVESEVDRGSTFWIELVLSDAAPSRTEPTLDGGADGPVPPDTSGLILYIEDNGSNVRLMERVMQRRPGVQLMHAPCGEDGLRLARERRPNLIFLDLHLPDMSGEEVLHRLWQAGDLRSIPVAVLSADATPAQSRRLKASGAIAYLTKPLEIRQVLRLVDEVLARGGQTTEART